MELRRAIVLAVVATGLAAPVFAGEADVVAVQVDRRPDGAFDFHVTIRSNDRGSDHYADAFEVLAPDGAVLDWRELAHPHEGEQPFTRELAQVRIPAGIDHVVVRALHKPRGHDGIVQTVRVPR